MRLAHYGEISKAWDGRFIKQTSNICPNTHTDTLTNCPLCHCFQDFESRSRSEPVKKEPLGQKCGASCFQIRWFPWVSDGKQKAVIKSATWFLLMSHRKSRVYTLVDVLFYLPNLQGWGASSFKPSSCSGSSPIIHFSCYNHLFTASSWIILERMTT